MVKARKLKSGSWNIQAYSHKENGKAIYKSITAPTKAECEYKYAEFKKGRKAKPICKETVKECIEDYIGLSSVVLSPTTLSAYRKIQKHSFTSLMDLPLEKLDSELVQNAINIECKRLSPKGVPISAKTVKNEWSLLASALKSKGYQFSVRLPKVQHKNEELPPPSDVIQRIKGTDIELPCLLAMWCSLRLSEIKGLDCESIQSDILYVNQVRVKADGIEYLKDLAKTDSSIRKVKIPPYISELINCTDTMINYRENGKNAPLIAMPSDSIRHKFYAYTKGLNLTFHDLRHYFATISLTVLGINSKLVQVAGGWSSPNVMQSIYNQSINAEQEKAFDTRNEYFSKMLNEHIE